MKICFIAHPVAGDVEGNIKKITAILRRLNLEQPDIVPFAPYIADLLALQDTNHDERNRGISNGIELFNRLFIDQLWLYGDRISKGMMKEIELAWFLDIKIYGMTPETDHAFRALKLPAPKRVSVIERLSKYQAMRDKYATMLTGGAIPVLSEEYDTIYKRMRMLDAAVTRTISKMPEK